MLCTIDQVRRRLGIAGSDSAVEETLAEIVRAVSGEFCGPEGACRELEEANRTEYYDVEWGTSSLFLRVWPVVRIDEIREAVLGDWESVPAVPDSAWFFTAAGRVVRRWGPWLPGPQTVRVRYTAGYVPAEVAAAGGFGLMEGQAPVPADLAEAAIQQAVNNYNRRTAPGVTGEAVGGANVTFWAPQGLLPGVKATLQKYRRI
jgi:hypothetical protein